MGFYDSEGNYRNPGDDYCDSEGCYRKPGEGFYDSKGFYVQPGEGFYDSKGYYVQPGEGFYDSKGYYVKDNFSGISVEQRLGEGFIGIVGFILFIPIAVIWAMVMFLIEWITSHIYVTFIGYALIDAVINFVISKFKKHQGVKFAISYLGNYICILSLLYIALVYAVPYVVVNNKSFGSIFEFTLVLACGFGAICIVQFFNYFHENAILEFILGISLFILVIILLKNNVNGTSKLSDFAALYHVEITPLMKSLFGFVF